jgi:hypothetical protein
MERSDQVVLGSRNKLVVGVFDGIVDEAVYPELPLLGIDVGDSQGSIDHELLPPDLIGW